MPDKINEQYEAYPYPSRTADEETTRLIQGSPSDIHEINHYLFAGKRDWSQPFRALFAGGGTGDGLIQCTQQLAWENCPAEIIYLDMSVASRKIAEARANARGLSNIHFETDTLLNAKAYGPFDYIDCCGVLHHLEDPLAGFNALHRSLAPGGGLGIMVYGRLGRTGVYEAQDMLKMLTQNTSLAASVETAKRFLDALPDTNWLKRNISIGDYKTGDAGLVDLLLHGRDRAYSVNEFCDSLMQSGLDLISFIEPDRYRPEFYTQDPALLEGLTLLSAQERMSFSEQFAGNLKVHIAYVAPSKGSDGRKAKPGPKMIPIPHRIDMAALSQTARSGKPIGLTFDGLTVHLRLPPNASAILKLIDGKRCLEEIMHLTGQSDWITFSRDFKAVYEPLNGINKLLLRQSAKR